MLRRLIANGLTLLGGQVGASLIMMVAVAANARALGLADFGALVMVQSSALLVAGLSAFATQQAVIRMGIEALESGDRQRFAHILGLGFVADLIGAALAGAIGLLALPWLLRAAALPASATPLALAAALCLFVQGFRTTEAIFRIFDRFRTLALVHLIAALVALALALWLWAGGYGLEHYVVYVVVVLSLPSLLQLGFAVVLLAQRNARPSLAGASREKALLREFVAYCWTTHFSGTVDTIRQNGDSPLVGALLSVELAGIYNVAKQLSGILRKGTAVYASVMFPELASIAARKQYDAARQTLRQALLASAAMGTAVVLGAAVMGAFVLELVFGRGYEAGAVALVVLCLSAAIQLSSATLSMYVQAFIGPTRLAFAYLVTIFVFIAALPSGIILGGIEGAAGAQVLFYLVLSAACWLELRRRTGWLRN